MVVASVGITAALEIHSISLKTRLQNDLSSRAEAGIESLMETDLGRLRTAARSGAENPVGELFGYVQTSPLSCGDLSKLDCVDMDGEKGRVCRAPESESGVVKIKYISCIGDASFRGERFIYVREN